MSSWQLRGIAAVGIAVLFYFVPLVRVVSLEKAKEQAEQETFDPASFAASFWEDQLLASVGNAKDAAEVVAALQADPTAAGETHGTFVGVGRGFSLYLKGEGEVVEQSKKGVLVRLNEKQQLLIKTGPLFGSAIRDASGLLKGNEAPSSREYNAVAQELNKLAEEKVIPSLSDLQPGDRLSFVGCAKVANPSRYQAPLVLHPIVAEAL